MHATARAHGTALATGKSALALTTPSRPSQESPALVLDNDLYLLPTRGPSTRGWQPPTSRPPLRRSSVGQRPHPALMTNDALINKARPEGGLWTGHAAAAALHAAALEKAEKLAKAHESHRRRN
eukprot:scaffold42443_cov33-Tisochrysis_lutea.AAC.3